MLTILTESKPKKQSIRRRLASNSVSLAVHVGLLFGAVFLTTKEPELPVDDSWQTDVIIFPKVEKQKLGRVEALNRSTVLVPQVFTAPINIPNGIPPVDLGSMSGFEDHEIAYNTNFDPFGRYEHTPTDFHGVFETIAVDEEPIRISSPPLEYPNMMRRAGLEGTVVIRAIVDTTGRVEPESMKVVQSDFSAFEGPALRLLRMSRFRPGRVRGTPVRVLIQIPIQFSLVDR